MSLAQSEREAVEIIAKDLHPYFECAEACFNLLAAVSEATPEQDLDQMPQALKVCSNLMCRLANELRCACILAKTGYAVQAASLVASAYEIAYTIRYVGTDENRAQSWIDHDDPTQLYRSVRTLVADFATKMQVQDVDLATQRLYGIYRQLCWAKHANPLLQMQFGNTLNYESRTVEFHNGPETSPQALRVAAFALEQSAGLAHFAAFAYASNWLPTDRFQVVAPELARMAEQFTALRQGSVARWGGENPFPDKL